jgi:hypothetical protein
LQASSGRIERPVKTMGLGIMACIEVDGAFDVRGT